MVGFFGRNSSRMFQARQFLAIAGANEWRGIIRIKRDGEEVQLVDLRRPRGLDELMDRRSSRASKRPSILRRPGTVGVYGRCPRGTFWPEGSRALDDRLLGRDTLGGLGRQANWNHQRLAWLPGTCGSCRFFPATAWDVGLRWFSTRWRSSAESGSSCLSCGRFSALLH